MEEKWFCKIAGDLRQHVHNGLLHCHLKRWMHSCADLCRAQQQAQWHCLCSKAQWHSPGRYGVLSSQPQWSLPKYDTSTAIAAVRDHGWRLVMLPSLMPNPLPPIMKIKTVNFVSWPSTISCRRWGYMVDWTLFCLGLFCCLSVSYMISTEIISFLYIRVSCLFESQYPPLFLKSLYIPEVSYKLSPFFFCKGDSQFWQVTVKLYVWGTTCSEKATPFDSPWLPGIWQFIFWEGCSL